MVQRSSGLTGRLEDYLEAVLMLIRQTGAARVRDIAARTDVSMSSVTAALKQLAQVGLVHYDPYELVRLTGEGEVLAEKILHKHDALASFLRNVLNVDAETAEANACRMEHVVDDQVLRRLGLLVAFLGESPPEGEDWMESFSAYCRQRERREDVPGPAGTKARAHEPPEEGAA